MYRVKSSAVWHSLPGVVAAYQPQYAPGMRDSLGNMANRGDPRYPATAGAMPTFAPPTGWTLGLTSQLETGILPENNQQWSLAARFVRSAGGSGYGALLGNIGTNAGPGIGLYSNSGQTYLAWAANAPNGTERVLFGSAPTKGVVIISGRNAYLNGVYVGTTASGSSSAWTATITIGKNGVSMSAFVGTLQCALVVSRPLSSAEVWLTYQQMTHLENPAWNAWARQRRYYYAPSAAAGAVRISPSRASLGGGPGAPTITPVRFQ